MVERESLGGRICAYGPRMMEADGCVVERCGAQYRGSVHGTSTCRAQCVPLSGFLEILLIYRYAFISPSIDQNASPQSECGMYTRNRLSGYTGH